MMNSELYTNTSSEHVLHVHYTTAWDRNGQMEQLNNRQIMYEKNTLKMTGQNNGQSPRRSY